MHIAQLMPLPLHDVCWINASEVTTLWRYTNMMMPLPLTVSCFCKIQIGFTFLVPAHPGGPRQRAIKRVCVWSGSLKVPESCGKSLKMTNLFSAFFNVLYYNVRLPTEPFLSQLATGMCNMCDLHKRCVKCQFI